MQTEKQLEGVINSLKRTGEASNVYSCWIAVPLKREKLLL